MSSTSNRAQTAHRAAAAGRSRQEQAARRRFALGIDGGGEGGDDQTRPSTPQHSTARSLTSHANHLAAEIAQWGPLLLLLLLPLLLLLLLLQPLQLSAAFRVTGPVRFESFVTCRFCAADPPPAPPNKTLAGLLLLLLLQGMHSPACTGIRPAAGRASSAASFRRLDGALVWWAPAAPMHPQPGRPAGCKRTGWEGGGETSTRPRVITVRDRISRLRGGRRADAGTLCDGTQKREARFLHDALPCSGASDLSRARTDLQVRHGEVESGRPHPLHRGRAGRRRRAPLGRGGEGRPRASLPWPTYLLWRPGGVV